MPSQTPATPPGRPAASRRGLHLVPAASPAQKTARTQKPDVLLTCHRCGGRELTLARIGMRLRAGKPTGGTPVYLCTLCLLQGQRVVVA